MDESKKWIDNLDSDAAHSVVGVEIRGRGFGFAVFSNSSIVEFGNRRCQGSARAVQASRQIGHIIDTFHPEQIIIRQTRDRDLSANSITIRKAILHDAKRRGIRVQLVSTSAVQRCFRRWNAQTKYEISTAIASLLPEMEWALPPKRRPWESEHPRMSIFDAAASVISHFNQDGPTRLS